MRCPNCDTENREGAKFCDECGTRLPCASESDVTMKIDATEDHSEEADKLESAEEPGEDEPEAEDDDQIGEGDASESSESDDEEMLPEPDLPPVSAYDDDLPFEEQKTEYLNADLSGFDRSFDYGERLVDPGYKEPTVDWRDGGTMKMPSVEGEEPPKRHDFLESSSVKKSNKGKVAGGIVAAIVVVAAIIAIATYQMQLWGGIGVPDVIGMTEADATSVLEEQGFEVRSTQVKSDDTEGLVLVMDPDANSRADEGSEVIIHISSARTIPAVLGKTQEEAETAFEDEGFSNVVYEKERSDDPEGSVLSIVPEVGTRAKAAQEIIVKVAEPFVVPDVAGMYLQEAQSTIEAAGLAYDYEYVNTVDTPDGQIMGTWPAAGETVTHDTVVAIQIARARGVELEDLTRAYLAPGNAVTIGMYNYAIESLDSVEYLGDDSVSYTMTARPFTYILGETVSISARQVSGVVVWNEDNTIASIS